MIYYIQEKKRSQKIMCHSYRKQEEQVGMEKKKLGETRINSYKTKSIRAFQQKIDEQF